MVIPPKFMIIGHARHGKDTVCEYIVNKYKLAYESSSHFAARKFIFNKMKDIHGYKTVEECLEDRVNYRDTWYHLIATYNKDDPARLGKELYAENDIYCGLRHKREFHAMKNQGVFDYVIWVDRSDHLPPEDKSSMTLEPWMADFVIDNNGSLKETQHNTRDLMDYLLVKDLGYHAIDVLTNRQ